MILFENILATLEFRQKSLLIGEYHNITVKRKYFKIAKNICNLLTVLFFAASISQLHRADAEASFLNDSNIIDWQIMKTLK